MSPSLAIRFTRWAKLRRTSSDLHSWWQTMCNRPVMESIMRTDPRLRDNDRVRQMTADGANRKIDAQTEAAIHRAATGGRSAVEQRLTALAREWDVDRVLVLNFAVLVFAQLVAAKKDRRWLWGPLIQTPFLFMHATLGWCPPVLWFRPMGFRTRFEIQAEREALLRQVGAR